MRKLVIFAVLFPVWSFGALKFTPFEGYGAGATGGSTTCHVTAATASAFNACLVSGKYIVFDVGGTISGGFSIPSNVTIDGFSAPSVVTFTGGTNNFGCLWVLNNANVIIQGIRVRNCNAGDNTKGIEVFADTGTAHDVVIDHCEVSDVSDEDIGTSGSGAGHNAYNITVSWNFLYAPASSGGELVKYGAYNVSIHHNLWVHLNGNDSRVPLVWAGNDDTTVSSPQGATIADVVGNVAQDYRYGITYLTDGTLQDNSNIINNYMGDADIVPDHNANAIDIMGSSLEKHFIAGNATKNNPAGTPSLYSCGASNICGTITVTNANTLSCGALTGCQPATPFTMPTITTSCYYDKTARIAEWTNVINNSGVVTSFADDTTASTARSAATALISGMTSALNQTWNAQTGTCATVGPPAPAIGIFAFFRQETFH